MEAKVRTFLSLLICLGLGFALSACGGGSGGVSVQIDRAAPEIPNIESWSTMTLPGTASLKGISQDTSYSANAVAETPPAYSFGATDVSTTSTISIQFDVDGAIEKIDIQTPNVTLAWNKFDGDLIYDGNKRAILTDNAGTFLGAFVQPHHPLVSWEYQTFGVWETNRGTGNGLIGNISLGIPTADSALPTTGVVQFAGETMGMFIDADGTDYLTYSDLTVDLDFAHLENKLDLQSTNTKRIMVDSLPGATIGVDDSSLDFNGFLDYDAASATFSGDVTGVGWAGSSKGQFYGPNAEELGGVFSLSRGDGAFYSGAYGAAR